MKINARLTVMMVCVAVLCASCGVRGTSSNQKGVPDTVVIEGHDYFKCESYPWNYVYTHKGNCRACEERWKKMEASLSR